MPLTQKLLTLRLMDRREPLTNAAQVVLWWELRRIPYNLIVGLTGLITCGIGLSLACATVGQEDSAGSPLLAIMGVIMYGIVANVCYTCGWIAELLARFLWRERAASFGQISFVFGLVFSVLLTLLPCFFFLIIFILRWASPPT